MMVLLGFNQLLLKDIDFVCVFVNWSAMKNSLGINLRFLDVMSGFERRKRTLLIHALKENDAKECNEIENKLYNCCEELDLRVSTEKCLL